MVHSAVLIAWMVMGLNPERPPMLVNTPASTWIKKARLRSLFLYGR